jgi:predicted ATP-grasp superfamily ATP-dependent carboligase
MVAALVADLAVIGRHHLVVTADARFPVAAPSGVDVVTLRSSDPAPLEVLVAAADAVWLIAPETDRCLERLAARVERRGRILLGPGAAAIRRASAKAGLPRRLARHGVPHPPTRVLHADADPSTAWMARPRAAVRDLGYPLVVKPARAAGCQGVSLARDWRELAAAVELARRVQRAGPVLLQQYVRGVAASVSLVADGRRAVALALNAQDVRPGRPFAYHGGSTALDHPRARRAIEAAERVCEALPGLRGLVGVDLVLTDADAVVIEVNPRLTTAYVGVREALRDAVGNLAALALAACAGVLPAPPAAAREIHFTAAGRVADPAVA